MFGVDAMKTTEAARLFEENYKLAMYFLWKHYPAVAMDEDMQQEAFLGLWKACLSYDPGKAEFSTWAGYGVRCQVLMALRKDCRQLDTVSLEATIEGTEGLKLEDIVSEVVPSICDGYIELMDFLRNLPEKKQLLVQCRLEGMTQHEIAKRIGYSQAYCSRMLKAIRQEYSNRKE